MSVFWHAPMPNDLICSGFITLSLYNYGHIEKKLKF